MSDNGHNSIRIRHLISLIASLVLIATGAWALSSCNWTHRDDIDLEEENPAVTEQRDPLPGELVERILKEDSIREVKKVEIKQNMTRILNEYAQKFRQAHFNGYFLTDFNDDDIPELWIKVGSYRDNCKLELYYPMPDGSLKKSDIFAEPGKYYMGDNYMMQVVSAGPGFINVSKITIHNAQMNVVREREIDLYSDPQASIPKLKEPEIKDNAFTNLAPLNRAFN